MELNSVLFPAPKRTLTEEDMKNLEPNLIWVPVYETTGDFKLNTGKLASQLTSYFLKKADAQKSADSIMVEASSYSHKSEFSRSAVAEGLASSKKPRKSSLSRLKQNSECSASVDRGGLEGSSMIQVAASLNLRGNQKRSVVSTSIHQQGDTRSMPGVNSIQTVSRQRIGPRVAMSDPLGVSGDPDDGFGPTAPTVMNAVTKDFKEGIRQAVRVSAHKQTLSCISESSTERKMPDPDSKPTTKPFRPFCEILCGPLLKQPSGFPQTVSNEISTLNRHKTTLDFNKHRFAVNLKILPTKARRVEMQPRIQMIKSPELFLRHSLKGGAFEQPKQTNSLANAAHAANESLAHDTSLGTLQRDQSFGLPPDANYFSLKPRKTSMERMRDKIAKQSNVLMFGKSTYQIPNGPTKACSDVRTSRRDIDSSQLKTASAMVTTQETSGRIPHDSLQVKVATCPASESDVDDSMTEGANLNCKRVLATKLKGNLNPFGGGVKLLGAGVLGGSTHFKQGPLEYSEVGVDSNQAGFSLARKINMLERRYPVKPSARDTLMDGRGKSEACSTVPTHKIPCLYYPAPHSDLLQQSLSKSLFIYLHGNAEDLIDGSAVPLLINSHFNTNVLMMEFAGYSLYTERQPSETQIQKDLETVVDYALNSLGFKKDKIIIVGRSIGSGPAVHVASGLAIGGLVLISPFTSIKNVANSVPFVGKLAGLLVKERFDNKSKIQNIKCRFLIIHGEKDGLIPISQSVELMELSQGKASLYSVHEMTHEITNFYSQIYIPMREYLMTLGYFQPGD